MSAQQKAHTAKAPAPKVEAPKAEIPKPAAPMAVGQTKAAKDLSLALKGDHGQYEVSRDGHTYRVMVDAGGPVRFVPEVTPAPAPVTDQDWIIKKISE